MNRRSIVLLALASGAFAQTKPPGGMEVRYADGTVIEIHSESTGTNLPLSTRGTESVKTGHDFHRLVFTNDPVDGTVILGYDIEARKSGAGTCLLRIKPVDTSRLKVGGRGKWLEIPTISAAREFPPLLPGDAVEVDILRNPATGERIFDVLKVLPARQPSDPSAGQFSLFDFRVAVNGQTVADQPGIGMQGAGVMLYLPGRGEFYLALLPSSDLAFQAAGWADHSTLRFYAGSELVELIAKTNVIQGADFATVWVYRRSDAALEKQWAEAHRSFEMACYDDVKAQIRARTGSVKNAQ